MLLAACGTSGDDGPITGSVAKDQTWAGDVTLERFVTIETGVHVTVEPGTVVHMATGASLEVDGSLVMTGTKDAPITVTSPPGEFWLGINVYGTLDMAYVTQTGGGVYTQAPEAKATIVDSKLSSAVGDFLVMNDGSLDVTYTNVGVPDGDHTHCNVHVNGARSIRFAHNNNIGVAYGLMLYAGNGDFSHDNWMGNVYDIEPNPAGTGKFDDSYFERGVPSGVVGSTFANPATAPLADCGPR